MSLQSHTEPIAENLRYLLWRERVRRPMWSEQLASWAQCGVDRAASLLQRGDLTADEQERIGMVLRLSEESLRFSRLVEEEQVNILGENLRYLLGSLPYGDKGDFAEQIGASPTTVSRWSSGAQRPSSGHLLAISRYFDLPVGTRLEMDPIFLSLSPVSSTEQRDWVHQQVDRLDRSELRALFPALEKLLRTP